MTSRYVPNEQACPIDLRLLGTLLRATEPEIADIAHSWPSSLRVSVALFCFQRSHMRSLAFSIARLCESEDLRRSGGLVGELLAEGSRIADNQSSRGRGVSLARVA